MYWLPLIGLLVANVQQPARDRPTPVAEGKGVIAGRVTVMDSKPVSPVRRARVTLSGDALRQPEVTDTGIDGSYRFESLPGGTYRVSVSKPGFVTLEAGATRGGERPAPIAVSDGAPVAADVALPRGAAIEGRLQNEAGEPLPNTVVSAIRFRQTAAGPRTLLIREARTDDLGRYRLHSLPEGDYYVEAVPDPRLVDQDSGVPGERPPGTARTFFPGTAHAHEARKLTLSRGQEAAGTDFTVGAVPLARVGGRVVDATGKPASGFSVRMRPVGGLPVSIGGTMAFAESRYHLPSVPPGDYWIMAAVLPGPGAVLEFAAVRVQVTGQDLPDVTLATTPGAVLSGRVETDGSPLPALTGVYVDLLATQFEMPPSRPVVARVSPAADGTFLVNGAFGPNYLRLSGLPQGWALKSVVIDDVDGTDVATDFRAANEPRSVRMVITDKTAALTGSVAAGERPVAAYQVIVFSDQDRSWGEASRFVKAASPRADRTFSVSGLLPGKYLVAAVQAADDGAWNDPEFLRKLRPEATPVTISEQGVQKTMTLQLQVLR